MKCALCSNDFNDGVQCAVCKNYMDFGCAQITEVGWRKLGVNKRSAWRCASCKGLSPTPSPVPQSPIASPFSGSEPATLDMVLKEIQCLKSQLAGVPTLIVDVKKIKDEVSELKASSEFNNSKIIELTEKLSSLDGRISRVEKWEVTIDSLLSQDTLFKTQLSASEQRSRLNNVEIKGVPTKKDENLFTILGSISAKVNCPFPKAQINYIYRVPVHNSKEKSIIVSFLNRYVKEEFVAAARAYKILTADEVGFEGSPQRIFVNDHLTAESKNLLTKTKVMAKEKGYNYVWVKFGKIHIRKNDTSQMHIIAKESDLNKMA